MLRSGGWGATVATVAVLVLGCRSGTARAGNQYSFFLGNVAAMSGGAVTVVGDDGASLWYNPAGLVAVQRDSLDLSGSAYMLRIRDYPAVLRGDLPDRDDDADPRLDLETTEILTVPSALAFVRNLTPDLSLGFGVFVPLLDGYSARSEMTLREPAASLDASVELAGDDTVYVAAVGLGWRTLPTLRLGATLNLFYEATELSQTLLFGYDPPGDATPAKGNGAIVQEDAVERFGAGLALGAQWQMTPSWALGVVLRSPVVQLFQSIEQRRFQLGADVAPDGVTTVVSQFEPHRESGFDASIYLNLSVTLALAWTPGPDSFLALELDVQPGSRDDGVERQLVWNMRLGGVARVSDTVRLGAGLFTDRSWMPEPTAAWSEQVDYYGVAAGVYLETPIALADKQKADSLVFTSTLALRYAIGLGETVRAVADPTGVHTDPSGATIGLTFHEISVHVGSGLRF